MSNRRIISQLKAISYCSYAENSRPIYDALFLRFWSNMAASDIAFDSWKVLLFLMSMYIFLLLADMLMLYKQRRPLLFANYSVCHNSLSF